MAMPVPVPDPSHDSPAYGEREDAQPIGPMTPEEFDAFEAASDVQHEYVGGMAYAMSGGTIAHSLIGGNVFAALRGRARGTGCRVLGRNMRVLTPNGSEYYPDALVHCGPRPPTDVRRLDEGACLKVEVLSPSTRRVDLFEKRHAYTEIASLQAYWMVESTWRCVYRHWRNADGTWRFEEVTNGGVLPVPCLGGTLTLDEVYEDVEVPTEPPRAPLRRVREPDAEYACDAAADEGAAVAPVR